MNRVLHVAETAQGGVATVMRQLLRWQLSSGVDARALVPEGHLFEFEGLSDIETFRRSGRNIASIWCFALELALAVWRLEPQVVHLHSSFAGGVGRIVLILMRPFRRPAVIYCPHGWGFLMDVKPWKKAAFAAVERLLSRWCNGIVCVSEHEKSEAMRWRLPAHILHVIRNCVEAPLPIERLAGLDDGKVNLVYVGRFDRAKGLDILIEAMGQLQDADVALTVIGAGVHEDRQVRPCRNIAYVGWRGREDVAGYLARADVLVMPSRWEAFGLAAVEAFSYGLPVLGSDIAPLREIITAELDGAFFAAGRSDDLASQLRQRKRSHWRRMREQAYSTYVARFRSERMCVEIDDLYRETQQRIEQRGCKPTA
ncbi:glycosyltransferase [Cognatilysobacter bugurensis]|uniref:glycosyltransferase n=1 Tax=Cognatilysobacter bugurensis TaxID=543356 RepID=UPI0016721FBE